MDQGLDPKKNRTLPELKYDFVYRIKNEFPNVNFVMNGGLTDINDCVEQLKYLDGVMVGRAIQANPFFIQEVDNIFYDEPLKTLSKKYILKEYLKFIKRSPTKHIPLNQSLRHLYGLNKGCIGAKKFRQEINNFIIKKDLDSSVDSLSKFLD